MPHFLTCILSLKINVLKLLPYLLRAIELTHCVVEAVSKCLAILYSVMFIHFCASTEMLISINSIYMFPGDTSKVYSEVNTIRKGIVFLASCNATLYKAIQIIP